MTFTELKLSIEKWRKSEVGVGRNDVKKDITVWRSLQKSQLH